jgi:hypothetical protein
MTLLTIIQDVTDLLSLPRPSAVVASPDAQVRQLYALANEEGKELASRGDWQALVRQQTFVTTDTTEQTSAVPADLDRFIANSFFNRTTRRNLLGPLTPQDWQAIQAQPQLNRVYISWRQRDNKFLVTPDPVPPSETIAYEYVTKNWATSASGTPQSRFLADDDTSVLDEELIKLGVRWRFMKSKGLEYAEDFRTYQTQVQQARGRDGGATRLNLRGYDGFVASIYPEGNFSGTVAG